MFVSEGLCMIVKWLIHYMYIILDISIFLSSTWYRTYFLPGMEGTWI